MGKQTKTVYTCDRCGKEIVKDVFTIGRFKWLHMFKWFVPQPHPHYPLRYICEDCFKSFKKWYGEDDHD